MSDVGEKVKELGSKGAWGYGCDGQLNAEGVPRYDCSERYRRTCYLIGGLSGFPT